MKKLLLMRHAKSSWGDASLADFDRPLNERGLRAAPLMGRHLRGRRAAPDLILCSPAARARRTAELVAETAEFSAPLRFDERIYEATAARLAEVVAEAPADDGEVLLVGHNPGMEELLELLTGEWHRMPTAAVACVRLDVETWGELRPRAGRLEWHVKPKDLEG